MIFVVFAVFSLYTASKSLYSSFSFSSKALRVVFETLTSVRDRSSRSFESSGSVDRSGSIYFQTLPIFAKPFTTNSQGLQSESLSSIIAFELEEVEVVAITMLNSEIMILQSLKSI
jgi:hypothetical protein